MNLVGASIIALSDVDTSTSFGTTEQLVVSAKENLWVGVEERCREVPPCICLLLQNWPYYGAKAKGGLWMLLLEGQNCTMSDNSNLSVGRELNRRKCCWL